jgi:hypothetical protein
MVWFPTTAEVMGKRAIYFPESRSKGKETKYFDLVFIRFLRLDKSLPEFSFSSVIDFSKSGE